MFKPPSQIVFLPWKELKNCSLHTKTNCFFSIQEKAHQAQSPIVLAPDEREIVKVQRGPLDRRSPHIPSAYLTEPISPASSKCSQVEYIYSKNLF